AQHCRALVRKEIPGPVPSLPIIALRAHRIGDRNANDRCAAAIPTEEDNAAPGFRESNPRLFHVDRQCADRCDLHEIEMALRARLRRVELPPKIVASVGKTRLLLNRLLAHEGLIPGKMVESASSIENYELPPAIRNPGRAVEVLFSQIG